MDAREPVLNAELALAATSRWSRVVGHLGAAWRLAWRAAAGVALLVGGAFLVLNAADFWPLDGQRLLGIFVLLYYALLAGAAVGLAAGLWRLAWRLSGPWMLLPVSTALVGAVGAAALTLLVLSAKMPRNAGVHGGGDVAALLALAGLGVAALLGGIVGGLLGLVLAAVLARRARSRRACANPR